MSLRRLLLSVVALVALLAPPTAALAVQQREHSQVVTLALGDVAKVAGGRVGCVARIEQGAHVLDCRRIGALAGTYGTILSGTKAMVVRFRPGDTARVVFVAHHGSARTHVCRSSP